MPDILLPDSAGGDHAHSGAYAPVPGAWTAPTFENSWVDYGGAFKVVRYRLNGTNVELEGMAKSGASGTVMFTLPAGHRPTGSIYCHGIASGGALAELEIASTGTVTVVNGAGASVTTWTSLTGVWFSTL